MKIKKYGELKHMMLSLTHRCNFKCRFCDIPMMKIDEVDYRTIERVMKEAVELGADTFTFTGGETLVRSDIFKISNIIKDDDIEVRLCTNGWLIDKKVAKKIKDSGVTNVSISLEGREKIHDNIRKKGSYKKVLAAIKNLQRVGLTEINLATVISKKNLDELEYVVNFAARHEIPTITFQPFSEMFLKKNDVKEIRKEFYISDYKKLEDKIEEIIELSKNKGVKLNSDLYLRNIPNYFKGKVFNRLCLAPFYELCMYPVGEVICCWEMPYMGLGNIKDKSLKEMFYSKRREKFLKNILKGKCSKCLLSCNYE